MCAYACISGSGPVMTTAVISYRHSWKGIYAGMRIVATMRSPSVKQRIAAEWAQLPVPAVSEAEMCWEPSFMASEKLACL